MRYPQSDDQKRRLRNVTQDQKWASRAQDQAKSGASKLQQQQQPLSPNQLLSEHMNAAGDPVPDPPAGTQDTRSKAFDDDTDVFEAMNANFD